MESDLKRGIEIRKSVRLPSTKRMAPAPPLPPRSSTTTAADDSAAKPEPPLTSLRQLLGKNNKNNNDVDSRSRRVPHQASSLSSSATPAEVETNANDKRQLAVRTDGGVGIAAPTNLVVDDGVHKLNLKNLQIATDKHSVVTTHDSDNMVGRGENPPTNQQQQPQQQKVQQATSVRKMAPLSPSLVRKISSLNQQNSKSDRKDVTAHSRTTTTISAAAAAAHPIKLSDLDDLVKRRDYVNQEAMAGVAPLRMPLGGAAPSAGTTMTPEDMPQLTSIDVLNQIQQQITEMEVKHNEHQQFNDAYDESLEDVARYKERIKTSKRYGEKEELSLKHGTSNVASNQLLGYLGDYTGKVRPSTEVDDDNDRASEDENGHGFQRGSSVRKSTGGAVMGSKTLGSGAAHGKGKPVSRTASDTKNLETKIKMMREATAHHGPAEAVTKRAKPMTKLPFNFKPRILDTNEKHLCHQVTPPSVAVAASTNHSAGAPAAVTANYNNYQNRSDEYAVKKVPHPVDPSSGNMRLQAVQSHSKKLEQVMLGVFGVLIAVIDTIVAYRKLPVCCLSLVQSVNNLAGVLLGYELYRK